MTKFYVQAMNETPEAAALKVEQLMSGMPAWQEGQSASTQSEPVSVPSESPSPQSESAWNPTPVTSEPASQGGSSWDAGQTVSEPVEAPAAFIPPVTVEEPVAQPASVSEEQNLPVNNWGAQLPEQPASQSEPSIPQEEPLLPQGGPVEEKIDDEIPLPPDSGV